MLKFKHHLLLPTVDFFQKPDQNWSQDSDLGFLILYAGDPSGDLLTVVPNAYFFAVYFFFNLLLTDCMITTSRSAIRILKQIILRPNPRHSLSACGHTYLPVIVFKLQASLKHLQRMISICKDSILIHTQKIHACMHQTD